MRLSRGKRNGLVIGLLGALAAGPAHASVVERVVAVVGDRPVLLSELEARARPFLSRGPSSTSLATTLHGDLLREVLGRVIDDRLEERAAAVAGVRVSPEEVDHALAQVAREAKIPVAALLAEAQRQGLPEADYREELRRQLLEGKMLELRVRARVRVTDEDARAAYAAWIVEYARQQVVDVNILPLRLRPDASPATIAAGMKWASELAARARAGESFCALYRQFATHPGVGCGSSAPQPTAALPPPVADAVRALKEGEIADPILTDDGTVLLVRLHERPKPPAFDQVREAMHERALSDAIAQQRKLWLDELRRAAYVDERL